jgi:hypothetical protein
VLPGGGGANGSATIGASITAGNTGPKPTTSSVVPADAGRLAVAGEGLLVGIIVAVVGIL